MIALRDEKTLSSKVRINRIALIQALESGNYGQTRFKMFRAKNSYCPMGIAAVVMGINLKDLNEIPANIVTTIDKTYGLPRHVQYYIMYMNDNLQISLRNIACFLRNLTREQVKTHWGKYPIHGAIYWIT